MSTVKPSFSTAFPLAAAVIGQFRAAFGAGVAVIYVSEKGGEVGKPLNESRFTVIQGRDICISLKAQQQNGR